MSSGWYWKIVKPCQTVYKTRIWRQRKFKAIVFNNPYTKQYFNFLFVPLSFFKAFSNLYSQNCLVYLTKLAVRNYIILIYTKEAIWVTRWCNILESYTLIWKTFSFIAKTNNTIYDCLQQLLVQNYKRFIAYMTVLT